MKKHLKLFIAFFLLVIADVFLTSYNTPDLKKEANPLVLHMGLGWPALITCNIILLIVYYFCAKTAFNYQTMLADERLSLKQYTAWLFYGDKDKFRWCFTKRLKIWKPFWAMFGYSFCLTLIVTRSIAVVEWICVTANFLWKPYWYFRLSLPLDRIDVWVGIPLAFVFFAVWMKRECKKSSSAIDITY